MAMEGEAGNDSDLDALPSSSKYIDASADDSTSQRTTPTSLVADASSISTPFARHIGRNKACASCRERKLKCDGVRPICGQCSRAWNMRKRSLKGKGLTEEAMQGMERPCEYITTAARMSRGKAKVSASPILEIQNDLNTLQGAQRECRRLEQELKLANERLQIGVTPKTFQPNQDELSIAQVLASTMRSSGEMEGVHNPSLADAFGHHSTFTSFVEGLAQQAVAHEEGKAKNHDADDPPEQLPDPVHPFSFDSTINSSGHPGSSVGQADPLMELVLNGWPADFPAPSMVDTLVRVFFDEVSYGRLLFHPPRFFQRIAQGPTSSAFPHSAVLHAIFALAFIVKPELDPFFLALSGSAAESGVNLGASFAASVNEQEDILDSQIKQRHSKARSFADPAYQAGHKQGITMALQSRYDRERAKLGSAGYHSERAQYHLTIGMWEGGDLMSLARAAFMLTMKRYGCGELFDAWLSASISTRLCVALAINHSHPQGPTTTATRLRQRAPVDTVRLAMTGAPGDWLEEEERRRLMFLILLTDRSACAATLWANSLEEADVTVELPLLSNSDFLRGDRAPAPDAPRQTLQSPNLFVKHHIDGFNTMIKAAVLMGRIAAFLSRLPSFATEETMKANGGFDRLDNTLTAFALSLPFRATDPDEDGQIDVFRFVTYAIMHTDTLMLHEPLLRLNEQSEAMCEAACRSVLDLIRILIAANISFARLPPVLILCLSTAGRVLVKRLLKLRELTNDESQASGGEGGENDAEKIIEQLEFDIQHPTPFTWSFTPSHSTSNQTPAAGLGAPASSEKEEKLRAEIDLVFTYLCKVGQIWPLATRHAQGLAQMLGIDAAEPGALEHGIFNERGFTVS